MIPANQAQELVQTQQYIYYKYLILPAENE